MKKLFFTIALLLLSGSLAYGQKKMTVEQTLMNMEQEIGNGLVKNDMTVLDKYAADNMTFTDPGGNMVSKSQLTALFKSGDLKLDSSKIDNMKVNMFGNAATVTYTTMDKGMYKGRAIDGQSRWTDTFVKMGGKWKVVAIQGTPIMP